MKLRYSILPIMLVMLLAAQSFALIGVGFHWGFDFTTEMEKNEQDNVFTVGDALDSIPDELNGIINESDAFMYLSRMNFESTPINFGGKIFLDPKLLPVEFEVSVNMAVWQYDGVVNYVDPAASVANDTVTYAKEEITIDKIGGVNYLGVEKTPYGKFQLDGSLKRTFRRGKIIQPSVVGGVSAHFATPVLSSQLVSDALELGEDLSGVNWEELLTNPGNMKKILEEITDGAKKPKVGMHLGVGLKVKPPVVPLAVYVDGKYMILFNDIEDNVGISTKGILLNVGLLFNI